MNSSVYIDIFTLESEATKKTMTRTAGDADLNPCYIQRADVETENVPSSHSEVRDSIVVGFENFGIVENFISESVQSVQGHFDVRGSHPILTERNIITNKAFKTKWDNKGNNVDPCNRERECNSFVFNFWNSY